jgi:hypothetical protein
MVPATWLRSGVNFRLFLIPRKFRKFRKFDPSPFPRIATNRATRGTIVAS